MRNKLVVLILYLVQNLLLLRIFYLLHYQVSKRVNIAYITDYKRNMKISLMYVIIVNVFICYVYTDFSLKKVVQATKV